MPKQRFRQTEYSKDLAVLAEAMFLGGIRHEELWQALWHLV